MAVLFLGSFPMHYRKDEGKWQVEHSFYLWENLLRRSCRLSFWNKWVHPLCFSVQRPRGGAHFQVSPAGEILSGELVRSQGLGPGSLGHSWPCPQRRRRKRKTSTCWWGRGSPWSATWMWVLCFCACSSVCHLLWVQGSWTEDGSTYNFNTNDPCIFLT